ncbi:MAG: cytochrome c oxidase accessory protein CcoG [Bacteroidales bacterium]
METPNKTQSEQENFRDQLATIDKTGKRVWVYARKPSGKLTNARNIVGFLLMIFFFTAPFIKVDGEQLLLLDFLNRKFVLLGTQFWPQDFHLFFLVMITAMVFVILFTVTYGRLFCGWACPQTIFMELVFRRIEYWIEGNPARQKELNRSSWNLNKIWRKSLKHFVFYGISFVIGNYFLMYIIGSSEWIKLVSDDPFRHIAGLSGMMVFSFIFYFIFSWFREQVCTIVCPYGRLQGVLLDRNSIVISYDYNRGEPKASFNKNEDRNHAGKGDCVDCLQCVQVCPTGIDIRNGTQLECINCACCIDACNSVMKRFGFNPGLIRYASEKMIAAKEKFRYSARIIAYSSVLIILLGVITYFMLSRSPVESTVLRKPGMLYQDMGNGLISNLYDIKLVNKTNSDYPVELKLLSHQGRIQIIGNPVLLKKQSIGQSTFFVFIDKNNISAKGNKLKIGVFANGKQLDVASATFVGPQ